MLDDLPFFVLEEVHNVELSHGTDFDFCDRTVGFLACGGYDGLINFGFKRGAARSRRISRLSRRRPGTSRARSKGSLYYETLLQVTHPMRDPGKGGRRS